MRIANSTTNSPKHLADPDPDVVKYPHNCCFLSGWLGSKTWMTVLDVKGGTVLWSNSLTVEMHWRTFSPPIFRPGSFSSLTRISTKAICRFILGSTLFMTDGYFSSTGTYTEKRVINEKNTVNLDVTKLYLELIMQNNCN